MGVDEDVLGRLRIGPSVLFIGQRYLSLDTGRDPVLELISRKYNAGERIENWEDALKTSLTRQGPEFTVWLDSVSRNMPRPAWLQVVADFAWSALYTSAVDSVWVDALRTPWREIGRTVYTDSDRPDQPRNKLDLSCTLLFGSSRWADHSPIPMSPFELRRRRQHAVSLARRIPDLVTPRGILVLEGYGPDDWMSPDELALILDELGVGQTHVFSTSAQLASHPDMEMLVQAGKVVFHDEPLAALLTRGMEAGQIKSGMPLTGRETGHRIELKDRVLDIPVDLWRRTLHSSVILEDNLLADPPPLTGPARYSAFRQFLSHSDGKPDWAGYARGFAFDRDFEALLLEVVDSALAGKHLPDRPIIVHGATGTGKTVALAKLAFNIRRRRAHAVLFIPNRERPPAFAEIEGFVSWADDQGATGVLVVWDGMGSYEDYSALVQYLASRGSPAVVVGSMYRDESLSGRHVIDVPTTIRANEAERFARYLRKVDESLGRVTPSEKFIQEQGFLVSLYRLLPPSRLQLRTGVIREVGLAEARMTQTERERGVSITPRTAMELALAEAGVLDAIPPMLEQRTHLAGEDLPVVKKLTGLVMVPGQFGLRVPLELLLRALGRENYQDFIHLIGETDIFQWYEDEDGNIDVGPRTALEAEIVSQGRFGGASIEIEVVNELVRNLTHASSAIGSNREIEFISRLAQKIDPKQGPRRYQPYFDRVADALQSVRSERSVVDPKLMLQEGHLRREWVRSLEESAASDPKLRALEAGQLALETALEEVEEKFRNNRYLATNLATELAATLSTMAVVIMRSAGDRNQAMGYYRDAMDWLRDAQRWLPTSYYPLDVTAWSLADLVELGLLDGNARAEALALVIGAFESADPESFSDRDREQYLRRQQEIGRLFHQVDMEESAYEELLRSGSTAGIIVRALGMAGGPISAHWTIEGSAEAYAFCEQERQKLPKGVDQRYLETSLNLWWYSRAGERPFTRERVALPFSEADWIQVDRLTAAALEHGESIRPTRLLFLRGLSQFHLGEVSRAIATLKEVERESSSIRSRWNTIRAYVASTPTGEPQTFHGLIADAYEGGTRGEVFVEELHNRVGIRSVDFGRVPLGPGEPVRGGFMISFSLQGPIADSRALYDRARERERAPEARPHP